MAALNKRWVGTTSDPTVITNWAGISLRSPTYKWTASGSGTGEFYLELFAGGDPGISDPGTTSGAITGNDLAFANGTMGSLTASQFDFGDNDTLGYSTIYVRLADDADPDSKTLDFVKLYQIPKATDHVRIPAGSGTMAGYDFTGVAIGDFIVDDGAPAIGSAAIPLAIDPNLFDFSSGNTAYIHSVGNIAHDVRKAATGTTGSMGLYLTLTQATTLTVLAGTVGVAMIHGQTSTVATVRSTGATADIHLGNGVSLTTSYQTKGKITANCAGTTANVYGGTFTTEDDGAFTAINADRAAKLILNSIGTVGTLTMEETYTGLVDLLQSSEARTLSSVVQKGGSIQWDKGIVTISAHTTPTTKPQKITVSNL